MSATWRSLSAHCRELGWSKSRAVYALQNGLRHRTVPPLPPGHVVDWHNPDITYGLNVETGDLTLVRGVFGGPGLGFDIHTVSIEVLPPPDTEMPSPPTHPPPETKEKPRGRPPDYPVEIICQIARDYITVYGLPQSQAMLREKVSDECERNEFDVPGETRLKQIVGPIYKAHRSRKGHKVTN